MATELALAGYTVWEALAISEVFHLCKTQDIAAVVINAEVEDAKAAEVARHWITLRLIATSFLPAPGESSWHPTLRTSVWHECPEVYHATSQAPSQTHVFHDLPSALNCLGMVALRQPIIEQQAR